MNVKGDILGTEHCYMAVLLPLAMSTCGAVTSSSCPAGAGVRLQRGGVMQMLFVFLIFLAARLLLLLCYL